MYVNAIYKRYCIMQYILQVVTPQYLMYNVYIKY
jgi:hypothetical protein